MRFLTKGLLVLVILLAAPAAFAQVFGDGDVYNKEGISDGCGDTMNADECMFSGSSINTCIDQYCPQCGFNNTLTAASCYRLKGATGYCSCQGGGVTRDKWGQPMPVCKTSGFCSSRPI
jgi:hypothetical protein